MSSYLSLTSSADSKHVHPAANCLQYSPEKHLILHLFMWGEKSEKKCGHPLVVSMIGTRRDSHLPQICHPYFKFNIVSGPEDSNKYV